MKLKAAKKRIKALKRALARAELVRDEWCKEYTKLRDERRA